MDEKARRDYTIAGLPFYQTELVMGQTRMIDKIEREARKAGYSVDPTDENGFGEFIVDYGVKLLSISLIPADVSQAQKVRDGLVGASQLEAWLDENLDPTDVPGLIADFFVFSLRSRSKALRAVPLGPVTPDAPSQTQAIG